MGTLYITEFSSGASNTVQGAAPLAGWPAQAGQAVAFSDAGSTQSAAFGIATRIVRVHTDVICFIAIGTNPTANTSAARMSAGQTEYFGVVPGSKIAVIAA